MLRPGDSQYSNPASSVNATAANDRRLLLLSPGDSLSAKFRWSFVKTVALMLFAFGLLAIAIDVVQANRRLTEQIDLIVGVAQAGLPNAVWNLDDTAAGEILASLFQDPNVAYVDLSSAGKLMYRRARDGSSKSRFDDYRDRLVFLTKHLEIEHNGRPVGMVRLAYSKIPLYHTIATHVAGIVALALLLMLALSWRSMSMTKRLIFNPLNSLAGSAEAIKRGNLDLEIRAANRDEIGFLADAFDDMRISVKDLISQLRQANETLADQNQNLERIVGERTQEIAEKNEKLIRLLEEEAAHNEKITESLECAERILSALLPDKQLIEKCLPDHFLMWIPRDIVGGDIYFVHPMPRGALVAVMDCTGHGVPGAFITILALTGLRTIMSEKEGVEYDAANILKRLNAFVKYSLRQHTQEAESDDGLDAAICVIDMVERKLTFAGAHMPLFALRDGDTVHVEGDRQSLGYKRSDLEHAFENHEITYEKELTVYLCTDGLFQQLGGSGHLPFGKQRLKAVMADLAERPLAAQREALSRAFDKYRGHEEQLDDVTVLGFRLLENDSVPAPSGESRLHVMEGEVE